MLTFTYYLLCVHALVMCLNTDAYMLTYCGFHRREKTMTKSNLGKKGFILSSTLLTILEGSIGMTLAGGRTWSRDHGGTVYWFAQLLVTCSPDPPALWMNCYSGLVFQHQLAVMKMRLPSPQASLMKATLQLSPAPLTQQKLASRGRVICGWLGVW